MGFLTGSAGRAVFAALCQAQAFVQEEISATGHVEIKAYSSHFQVLGSTATVNARTLVAHEDSEYEEWGFSGSLAYTPGKDGRGLSMKLGSAWGSTQSGVQSLWSRQDASGLARNTPFEAAQRFQAELGYGIAGLRKAALWVPFIAAQAADGDSQSLRMGVKLTSGPNVEAGVDTGCLGLG